MLREAMQFYDEIRRQLDAHSDQGVREEARALFAELVPPIDEGGLKAIEALFEKKQDAIREEFDENLNRLKRTL